MSSQDNVRHDSEDPVSQNVLEVGPEGNDRRIDTFLAQTLQEPRSQIQKWIKHHLVLVDGARVKGSYRLSAGERICWTPLAPPEENLIAEPGELVVLADAADFVVIDKPSGLTVHPWGWPIYRHIGPPFLVPLSRSFWCWWAPGVPE